MDRIIVADHLGNEIYFNLNEMDKVIYYIGLKHIKVYVAFEDGMVYELFTKKKRKKLFSKKHRNYIATN